MPEHRSGDHRFLRVPLRKASTGQLGSKREQEIGRSDEPKPQMAADRSPECVARASCFERAAPDLRCDRQSEEWLELGFRASTALPSRQTVSARKLSGV